jgi:DNA-binding response OmpR family regulator
VSKQKLLLADDSITIQKVVNLTFADEGIEVIAVGDGNTAMEKFVESMPDLVMVDVNMPGLDGYRICEMIKQDEETKHVPVILLVGSFEPFDENEARRVGANDYLTKPFQSIRQLVNKVSVLLSKSNGSEAPVESAKTATESESRTVDNVPEIIIDDQATQAAPEPKIEIQSTEKYFQMIDDSKSEVEGAPIETLKVTDIEGQVQAESLPEPFGDAGMDDEMIQTNQVGSSPDEKVRVLDSEDEVPAILENTASHSTYDFRVEPVAESDAEAGKTQPFTAAEYEEISSSIPEIAEFEAAEKIYPDENVDEGDRDASLEKQMVSEFETADEKTTDLGTLSEGHRDEATGFQIEEYSDQPKIDSDENRFEPEMAEQGAGSWEIYESDDTPVIHEPETDFYDADEIPTIEVDGFGKIEENEPLENISAESIAEIDVTDAQTSIDDRQDFYTPQDSGQINYDDDVVESDVESFEEELSKSFTKVPDEPVYFDRKEADVSDHREDDQKNGIADQVDIEESEPSFHGAETLTGSESVIEEEIAQQTVEIPSPQPTIEEEVSPIQEIPQTEFKSAETTTHSPVSAMVSTKDTSDAVESVIVSEFARHSISLSSEAVETIAARIAEKISEKIVQQLATDVVTDLADLIVDRMEQRKLK